MFDGSRGDRSAKIYVYRKDGTRLQYETLAAVGNITVPATDPWRNPLYNRVWLLTEIRDTQSTPNVVSFSYIVSGKDHGYSYLPNKVSYAGYDLTFYYLDHDSAGFSTEIVGFDNLEPLRSEQFKRLSFIDIRDNSAPDDPIIRKYDLDYDDVNRLGIKRIEQIKGSSTLGTVSFDYDAASRPGPGQYSLLNEITDQIGGRTLVEYGLSTDDDFVTDDEIVGERMLVRSITQNNGKGGSDRKVSYAYHDSRYNTTRARSLGFRRVTAWLPLIQSETVLPYIISEYKNNSYAQNGVIDNRQFYVEGVLKRRIYYIWDGTWTGNGPWKAMPLQTRHESWEGGNYLQVTSSFETNLFGELTRIRNLGYTGNEGTNDLDPADSLLTAISYVSDIGNKYIVNKPEYVHSINGADYDLGKRLQSRRFTYDTRGNLTLSEAFGPWNSGGYRRLAGFSYDARGNVLEEKGPRANQITTHTYGGPASLFLTRTENAPETTPASVQVQTWTWDEKCQRPLQSTDINGLTTTFTYDVFCRETSQTLPTGHKIETAYRNYGNPATQYTEVSEPSAATGAPTMVSRTYFDGLGQTYRTARTGASASDSSLINILSFYDRRGNLNWQSLPIVGANPSEDVPSSNRTRFEHDGLDRITATFFADGAQETQAYEVTQQPNTGGTDISQQTVRSKNADCYATNPSVICRESLTIVGGRGWVTRDGPRDGTGGTGPFRFTSYTRDPLGRLIGAQDPRGSVWSYVYNKYGDRTTSTDPDLGTWGMTYDESGNLLTQTDAKTQTTSFTYDLLDRPLTKVAGGITTTYEYDTTSSGYYNVGNLTSLSNPTETITYGYGKLGGLQREVHGLDARTYEIKTSYLSNGLPNTVTLPSGPSGSGDQAVGSYRYDTANRMIGFGTQVTGVTYNAWDNPVTLSFSNGTVETRTYSAERGWLMRVEVEKGASLLLNTRLQRSASGLVTQSYPIRTHGRFNYTYDYDGRVLTSTNFGGQSGLDQVFTYNAAGSIASKKTGTAAALTYVYPAGTAARPHAPTSVGGVALAYDANGNMTTGFDGKTMTYDAENRVRTATRAGVTTTYTYGADGARLKRTLGGSGTLTIGPIEVRNYKATPGEQLLLYPDPLVRIESGTPAFVHTDQVNSIQLITDSAGAAAVTSTYRPFGEISTTATGAITAETMGFLSERYDDSPRLQYLNARYYDPALSLFTSPDWLEITDPGVGTNRYAYAGNSPLNQSDPGGNVLFQDGKTGEQKYYSPDSYFHKSQVAGGGTKCNNGKY